MINEVSHPLSVNPVVPNVQNGKRFKNVSNPVVSAENVSDYSVDNLKANYLSFKGNSNSSNPSATSELAGALENQNLVPFRRSKASNQVDNFLDFENISKISGKALIEGKYYEEQADNIAKALGPDKNIIVTHKDQFTSDILVHNFAKSVKNGQYNKIGLINYNTDVFVLDPANVEFDPEVDGSFKNVLLKRINEFSCKNPTREKVVFIKDFDDFLGSFGPRAKHMEDLFDRNIMNGRAHNLRLVGLMHEDEMKQKTTEELMSGEKQKFRLKDLKYVRKVEIPGLSANQTKAFMKNEVKYLNDVVKPYKTARFDITPGGIDALVDGCAYSYGGTFPQKAYDILSLMTTSLATDEKEIADSNDIKKFKINEDTVKDFYKNNSDLIKYFKMDDNVFSFSENVTTKMSDVGGAKEAKEELQKIIDFAHNPEAFLNDSELRSIPKGVIMDGPPGTGKTLLARAVAGEAGVPFATLSAPELLKKYLGEGEEAIREWMSGLRQAAKDSGKNVAIGFVDEIDAIGKARSAAGDGGSESKASILNQFLTELDGFNGKESDVHLVILAATNRKDILDPALVRPGRFDNVVNVLPPQTKEERLEVIEKHLKNLKFENEAQKTNILNEIATMTEGLSGAELAKMVGITKEIVANKPENKVATYNDMFEGFMQSVMGKKSYLERPFEERKNTAIHEAGHAILVDVLGLSKLSFISNQARANALGVTFFQPMKGNPNFKSVIKDMAISYAGGDAEGLFNAMGHEAGVSQDYKSLTAKAELAIKKWGLGINTPQISFKNQNDTANTYLEDLYKDAIKKDIELYTQMAKQVSEKFMDFHKDFLKDVYVPKFESEIKSGTGGNILSGDAFRKLRMDWITSSGKLKQYESLQNEIEKMIEDVQKNGKVATQAAENETKKLAEAVLEQSKETNKIAQKILEKTANRGSKMKPIAFATAGIAALGGLAYFGKQSNTEKKKLVAQA